MLADPLMARFGSQLGALLDRFEPEDLPVPRTVELALTGADPLRLVVDVSTGEISSRGPMGPPLTVQVPRRAFEDLVGQGPLAWLAAWDKGIVEVVGDPVKVEMVDVFVERVLRPMV